MYCIANALCFLRLRDRDSNTVCDLRLKREIETASGTLHCSQSRSVLHSSRKHLRHYVCMSLECASVS